MLKYCMSIGQLKVISGGTPDTISRHPSVPQHPGWEPLPYTVRFYLVEFSRWHFAKALQRFGSGQRSSGVWPFLFLMLRSAPLAARKHAIEAEDFLSAPWDPRPIRSLPTSCMSWNELKYLENLANKFVLIHVTVSCKAMNQYKGTIYYLERQINIEYTVLVNEYNYHWTSCQFM